jgi:DNA end-binding protein Ku
MAARSIWKGHIKFSVISIPVKMYNATSERNKVAFHQIHGVCNTRIKQQIYCPTCAKDIPKDELVKGYEWTEGNHIIVSEDEIANAKREKTDTIEIINFVNASEIPPVYYSDSHYLNPEKVGVDLFALLRQALIDSGKVAVGKIVIRAKENLVLIAPHDGVLIAYTLYYQEQLRTVEELPDREAVLSRQVDEASLGLAKQLIDNLSTPWDGSKFKDDYNDAILKVIERKANPLAQPEAPVVKKEPAKVVNILAALQAAVENTAKKKAINE